MGTRKIKDEEFQCMKEERWSTQQKSKERKKERKRTEKDALIYDQLPKKEMIKKKTEKENQWKGKEKRHCQPLVGRKPTCLSAEI